MREELTYTYRRHGRYLDIEFSRKPSHRVCERLGALGYIYKPLICSWRGTQKFDEALYIADKAVKDARAGVESNVSHRNTLCWDCANSGHGNTSICPWERDFEPVEGWDAEEVIKAISYGVDARVVDSYHVRSCPLFKPESVERKATAW